MKPEELEAAIRYLHPEAEFSFIEADYLSIKWDKIDGEPPTLEQIKTAVKEIADNTINNKKAKDLLMQRLGLSADDVKLLFS